MTAEQIGPYRIVQRLGAGGMGEVFLAEDVRLGRKVALKSLSLSGAQPAEARRKLLREARAVAKLNHPNIAAIYDVVESGTKAHIVMEYVPGETLAQTISRGPMAISTALGLGTQIAEALVEAHRAGIVHRDLKPANIALDPAGKPKILDFGLAYGGALDFSDSTGPTPLDPGRSSRVMVGTPQYIPPEHLLGRPIDARGDLYSLGVTLFELVTGQRPFHGADAAELADNVLNARRPRARDLRPDVPPDLDAAIARAMARRPEDRYASAAELRDALRDVMRGESAMPTRPMRGRGTLRPWADHRAAAVVAAALLTILAAGIGWHRWTRVPVLDYGAPQVVAVFPLRSEDRDPRDDAVGAGVADVLASSLSKVSGVTVLPRSATLSDTELAQAPIDVARRVGASLMVDGRVQRAGDRLRLVVQLIRAANGAVAWSDTYDATGTAWFDIQPRIAEDLAIALRPDLSKVERRRLKESVAADPSAFADYAQAWSYLERVDVPGSLDHAIALFQSAVRKGPRFARAYAGLGHACWQKFRATGGERWAAQARDAITEALRLDPDDASVHQALAVLYSDTGRPAEAMEEARAAIKVQPDFDSAYALLGDLLTDAGDRTAEAEYQRAIVLRPGYWRHHQGLGVFYFTVGRMDDAIRAFTRVTELRPDSSWGYQMLGTCYHTVGELEKAVPFYEKAIRLSPDARAFSNLGTAYYQLGKLDQARAAYLQAVALEPADPLKHRNLADLHRRVGEERAARQQYGEALRLGRKRLEVNPRDARALALIAVVEAKLGDVKAADRHAAEALALSPTSSDIVYKSAVVYALTSRPEDALAALARAVTMGFRTWEAAVDEDLASLRKDDRFVSLMARKEAS